MKLSPRITAIYLAAGCLANRLQADVTATVFSSISRSPFAQKNTDEDLPCLDKAKLFLATYLNSNATVDNSNFALRDPLYIQVVESQPLYFKTNHYGFVIDGTLHSQAFVLAVGPDFAERLKKLPPDQMGDKFFDVLAKFIKIIYPNLKDDDERWIAISLLEQDNGNVRKLSEKNIIAASPVHKIDMAEFINVYSDAKILRTDYFKHKIDLELDRASSLYHEVFHAQFAKIKTEETKLGVNVEESAADCFGLMTLLRDAKDDAALIKVKKYTELVSMIRARGVIREIASHFFTHSRIDLPHITTPAIEALLQKWPDIKALRKQQAYLKTLSEGQFVNAALKLAEQHALSETDQKYLASPDNTLRHKMSANLQLIFNRDDDCNKFLGSTDDPKVKQILFDQAFYTVRRTMSVTGMNASDAIDAVVDNNEILADLPNLQARLKAALTPKKSPTVQHHQ